VADPELAEELEAKEEQIAALKEQLAQVPTNRPPRSREDWQQRMEQWQKENPEEFQRMQEEREQRRQELAQRTTDRFKFFSEIPTEGLSEEYLVNHQTLLDRMQFMNEAMAQIAADPDSDASQQLRRDMRENLRGTHEMLEMEKEVLVNDLLTGVGISDQQATEVMDYMDYIDEMTSMGGFFGRGGGRPGGDRGGDRGGR
jgi:transketolase